MSVNFLKGLLSGEINYPDLLGMLSFKVSHRLTRSFASFYIPFCLSNYKKN